MSENGLGYGSPAPFCPYSPKLGEGVTTRALGRLRDCGLIEVRQRCIHVTDLAGLERVAKEEESRSSDPLAAPIHSTA
jgi:hypothetical protein